MKKIFLIVFVIHLLIAYKAKASDPDLVNFKKELLEYIGFIKEHSMKNGYYDVYVVKVFADSNYKDRYCYTLGDIFNDYGLDYLRPPRYYFEIDSEIVLISAPKDMPDFFKFLNYKKVDSAAMERIINKLGRGIMGFTSGLVYCKSGDEVRRRFYENADEIPFELSIFDFQLPPGKLEIIEYPMDSLKNKL